MIPKETVSDIIETARIEEVIGDFVQLKKAGSNYKGLSPFTDEKTPSFVVSPAKQIFKCFSTGKGGNVVTFLMELENLSYPEALKQLAQKYNIEIVEEQKTEEQKQELTKKESLYIVSNFAKDFFKESLANPNIDQAIGLKYFKDRGFTEQTINKFELGYSPNSWDALYKASVDRGYKVQFLEDTGLLRKKNDKYFDFFKGRIMFPIHNISGRTIAFGGRTLETSKSVAKYFNSPESDIYHKSDSLYGIYQSKQNIIKENKCFLVEGYTDVISLHQNGVNNVVASSGTSLTNGQIKLIKRYTTNITILYDGDNAGIKASFRGIDLILAAGLQVKVVLFPENEDPDSYSKTNGEEKLKQYITENEQDFVVFKSSILLKDTAHDPIKKADTIKDILHSISLIPDPISRSIYIKECSEMFDINENTLLNEVSTKHQQNEIKKVKKRTANQHSEEMPLEAFLPPDEIEKLNQKPTNNKNKSYYQEKGVVASLLEFIDKNIYDVIEQEDGEKVTIEIPFVNYIIDSISGDQFTIEDFALAGIYNIFKQNYLKDKPSTLKDFTLNPDQEISKLAADLISSPHELSKNWEKHYIFTTTLENNLKKHADYLLLNFKLKKIDIQIEYIHEQLKSKALSSESMMNLLQEKKQLDEIRKHFCKVLGIIIT